MAAIIDSQSVVGTKTELNLFDMPPTQVAVENCRWKEINLRNACTDTGPYEFHIGPDPQYLHLSKNYLLIQMKITREDGTNLNHVAAQNNPADPVIGPINLIGKTFVRQVKLMLNGNEVFDSGDKYAYRTYLETELNYGEDAKASHLKAAVYAKDKPPNTFDRVNNLGLTNRAQLFQDSVWVETMAPIHCDLFTQNKYLLNNVDLRLILYRNPDNFCLHSPNAAQNYKIHIGSMKWYVKGVDISKTVSLALEHALGRYTAKYPIKRVEIKTIHVEQNARETPTNAIFNGQIPRRLVIGCVDGDAYHGTYPKSPFNFKNFQITRVGITAGGQEFPAKPLSMDFANNLYTRAFVQLFEGLGISDDNKGIGIGLKEFKDGHCLFAFDLSPDEDDGNHWDLIKQGETSINIQFAPLAIGQSGAEIVIYAEFDNLITIDKFRNTFTDYKA